MTALSDALVAAQARAVAVLGKRYIGGNMDAEEVCSELESMGIRDAVDAGSWLNALGIIRDGGGEAPTEQRHHANGAEQPASAKQLDLIRTLCERKGVSLPDDMDGYTKAEASLAIDQLQRV